MTADRDRAGPFLRERSLGNVGASIGSRGRDQRTRSGAYGRGDRCFSRRTVLRGHRGLPARIGHAQVRGPALERVFPGTCCAGPGTTAGKTPPCSSTRSSQPWTSRPSPCVHAGSRHQNRRDHTPEHRRRQHFHPCRPPCCLCRRRTRHTAFRHLDPRGVPCPFRRQTTQERALQIRLERQLPPPGAQGLSPCQKHSTACSSPYDKRSAAHPVLPGCAALLLFRSYRFYSLPSADVGSRRILGSWLIANLPASASGTGSLRADHRLALIGAAPGASRRASDPQRGSQSRKLPPSKAVGRKISPPLQSAACLPAGKARYADE